EKIKTSPLSNNWRDFYPPTRGKPPRPRQGFPMAKILAVAAIVASLLSACADHPVSHPWPRSGWQMPPCVRYGLRGVWICDKQWNRCVCVTQREFEDWKRRNGL